MGSCKVKNRNRSKMFYSTLMQLFKIISISGTADVLSGCKSLAEIFRYSTEIILPIKTIVLSISNCNWQGFYHSQQVRRTGHFSEFNVLP